MHNATVLFQLHTDIDARVSAIRAHRPDWPCSKGCDHCCHQLAAVPRLTATEWDVLKQGLQLLDASRLQEICRAVAALPEAAQGPVVCPMLERESGDVHGVVEGLHGRRPRRDGARDDVLEGTAQGELVVGHVHEGSPLVSSDGAASTCRRVASARLDWLVTVPVEIPRIRAVSATE